MNSPCKLSLFRNGRDPYVLFSNAQGPPVHSKIIRICPTRAPYTCWFRPITSRPIRRSNRPSKTFFPVMHRDLCRPYSCVVAAAKRFWSCIYRLIQKNPGTQNRIISKCVKISAPNFAHLFTIKVCLSVLLHTVFRSLTTLKWRKRKLQERILHN